MAVGGQVQYLAEAARWAPSADNSQPWRLEFGDGLLTARYDDARVGGSTFPADNPATLLAVGTLLENLHQAAGVALIGLEPLDNANGSYFRVRVDRSGAAPPDIRAVALFGRHTNRLRFRPDPVPTPLLDWLGSQTEGAARVSFWTEGQHLARLAMLVTLSSEIRFQTRELHELLARSLRRTPAEADKGDGLDVATLHLPPGGTMMLRLVADWRRMRVLNRIGAYKAFARMEADAFVNASAIVAIAGSDSRQGAVEAGRLMERVWIELNRLGMAVHPFYVVADQLFRRRDQLLPAGLEPEGETLAGEADSTLGLAGDVLYMLLRVGHPTGTPVRSRRLPLQATSNL